MHIFTSGNMPSFTSTDAVNKMYTSILIKNKLFIEA